MRVRAWLAATAAPLAALAAAVDTAAAPDLASESTTVRCLGAAAVLASFDFGQEFHLADYTYPADGSDPRPTGRIWLSMPAATRRSINPACRRTASPKLQRPGILLGPYPRSHVGRLYCRVLPWVGFFMQFTSIRNRKRAVIGTKLFVIDARVRKVVIEARFTRATANFWFDGYHNACQRNPA